MVILIIPVAYRELCIKSVNRADGYIVPVKTPSIRTVVFIATNNRHPVKILLGLLYSEIGISGNKWLDQLKILFP
ncbi:MAG: hypothetical protein DRH37_09820 [Deltaproteobacteria bacterium]|nr:MAG: hypothetical protein DRH37_09820 [Deltaproteobacteria bacterium]